MLLPDFNASRILVVGDVMLDRYWYGATERISPEAPVPVVQVSDCKERLGGAANVALNCHDLGAQVSLLGVIGRDEAGQTLQNLVANTNINAEFLTHPECPTITKLRILSKNQQLIRLDFEEKEIMHALQPEVLFQHFKKALNAVDVVIFSDYGKGITPHLPTLIEWAHAQGKRVLVDPKSKDLNFYRKADLITPNLNEFEAVVGKTKDEADIIQKGQSLCETFELGAILVTRGAKGMILIRPNVPAESIPACAREVYDVTGAGDTVIAVYAVAVAAGLSDENAMQLANRAAGIVVGKVGTATATREELQHDLEHSAMSHSIQNRILNREQAVHLIRTLQKQGNKVVFTNGCFDIVHLGHVHYLEEAKKQGDVLIVGINDDDSVRALKGPTRPINPIHERLGVLAALRAVDYVLPFHEVSVLKTIEALRPDVLVKGGDYTIPTVVGSDVVLAYGGEVKVLSLVDGCSTTAIIERSQNSLDMEEQRIA